VAARSLPCGNWPAAVPFGLTLPRFPCLARRASSTPSQGISQLMTQASANYADTEAAIASSFQR
jgi:hypothetical protein